MGEVKHMGATLAADAVDRAHLNIGYLYGIADSLQGSDANRAGDIRQCAAVIIDGLIAASVDPDIETLRAENTRLRGDVRSYELTFNMMHETAAERDVLAERRRQVEAEGWTAEHDDCHGTGELAEAAACYAFYARYQPAGRPDLWPWDERSWKPKGQRSNLVKAGALILAEIERLDRLAKAESTNA